MGILQGMEGVISFPKAAPDPVPKDLSGVTSMHQELGQAANMNVGNALHTASNAMVGSAVSGGSLGGMIYAGGGGSAYGGGGGAMGSIYGMGIMSRQSVTIDTVENGFVVTVDQKCFICQDTQEVANTIISQMVTKKMEK